MCLAKIVSAMMWELLDSAPWPRGCSAAIIGRQRTRLLAENLVMGMPRLCQGWQRLSPFLPNRAVQYEVCAR